MLLSTERHPLVELVAKAQAIDPEGALQMVRLAAYDALHDEIAKVASELAEDMRIAAFQRTVEARRGLVRSYVTKRLEQGDVKPLLEAAQVVAAMSDELVSKDADEPRDARGRWTRVVDAGTAYASKPNGHDDTRNQMTAVLTRGKYGHLEAAGRALQATGSPGATAVGVAAELAGALGPEAQRVLGSRLKRAAYRYRGTEIRPSAQLVGGLQHEQPRPGDGRDQGTLLDDRGAVGVGALDGQVPTMDAYLLSEKSGKLPPSRGVIIDSRGRLAANVVGADGDYYVPFNLKNLGALHGGQYVRTRAAGGPTSEDFYTAVVGGARQMQVVSNSGVFTVRFDNDMRGGRRYSDGAARMVKRYDELLQTVRTGKIPAQDISDTDKINLRRSVFAQYGSADADFLDKEYDRQLQEARAKSSFLRGDETSGEDDSKAALDEYVRNKVEAGTQRYLRTQSRVTPAQLRDLRIDAEREGRGRLRAERDDVKSQAYRELRLDGEGFHRALKSLQQEFPQFIADVQYEERDDFLNSHGMGGGSRRPSGRNIAEPKLLQRVKLGAGAKAGSRDDNPEGVVSGGKPGERVSAAPTAATAAVNLPNPTPISYTDALAKMSIGASSDLARSVSGLTATSASLHGGEDWSKINLGDAEGQAKVQPLFTVAYFNEKAGGTGVSGARELLAYAQQLPDKELGILTEALERIGAGKLGSEDKRILGDETEDAEGGAADLLSALSLRDPFGPAKGTVEDATRVLEGGRPPAYAGLKEAGVSFANLKALGARLSPDSKAVAQADLAGKTDALRQAVDGLDAANQRKDGSATSATAALQQALDGVAFARAWKAAMAASDLGILDEDPGDGPFGLAAPAAAPVTSALKKPSLSLFSSPEETAKRDSPVGKMWTAPMSLAAQKMQAALVRKSGSSSRPATSGRLLPVRQSG